MNNTAPKSAAWLLFVGRAALFLANQAVFALVFSLAGRAQAWEAGATWRPRLLPYLAITHLLMDASFAAMLLPMGY